MAYTTINKGSSYFNTVLYTGNSGTQSITGVGFQPDFVWIKDRIGATATYSHYLFDTIRTATKYIKSNSTDVEATGANYLTSFDADGFSLGSFAGVNATGDAIVAWNWLASNTSGSSNTAGTITSTVAANTTAGFSIVSYTGTGANATVGHGLGVAPAMIICKSRTQAQNWAVYHQSLGNTKAIFLDGTGAATTSASYWNNTSPTSTVFTVGNSGDVNYNAGTQISYCFAEIRGFSKFASYSGNGSTNGTFVYTGFKPAFVLIKSSSTAENWHIFDDVRNTFNPADKDLRPNLSNAETTSSVSNIDFVSNGFKLRNSDADYNGSGTTYIYMAFAENPFVTSGGIPVTAR